jgi:hypothetical protein
MITPTTDRSVAAAAGGGDTSAGSGPLSPNTLSAQRSSRLSVWLGAALRDGAYVIAIFAWSIVAFSVLVTGLAVTASLLALVVGVAVWAGFVYAMRWTTWVDRRLAGWQRRQRIPASYRRPQARGIGPFVRTLTTDPQTWRDMVWLAVTSVVGFATGLVVVTAAGVIGAYVSMPFWCWAIDDPAAHRGLTNVGVFTVDGPGRALVMTLVGLLLVPVGLLLARSCAALHVRLAVLLLGS